MANSHEFNNRIDAQREILCLINAIRWKEELFGLSKGAIERFANNNHLDLSGDLVVILIRSAEKLFFLANKSQEQITDEYKSLSMEVSQLTSKLKNIVSNFN